MRQIELLVLAGGFGTRLRDAVPDVPKSLAPVLGRPYLQYLLEDWLHQGVTSLTFLLHHQAEVIEAFLKSQQERGELANCSVRTVREAEPLGTGGSIANAVRELQIAGSFLVANADTWLGGGIAELAQAPAPAIAIVEVDDAQRYGSVDVERGKVTYFGEKHGAGRGWINAGLYHLSADSFRNMAPSAFSLERTLLPRLAEQGQLSAIPLAADFIDIGIPKDYFRFCDWLARKRAGVL